MSTDKIELKHAEDSTVDSPQPEYLKEVTHLLSELTTKSISSPTATDVDALPGMTITRPEDGPTFPDSGNLDAPQSLNKRTNRSPEPRDDCPKNDELHSTSAEDLKHGHKLEDLKNSSIDAIENKNIATSIERQGKMDKVILDALDLASSQGRLHDKVGRINYILAARGSQFGLEVQYRELENLPLPSAGVEPHVLLMKPTKVWSPSGPVDAFAVIQDVIPSGNLIKHKFL